MKILNYFLVLLMIVFSVNTSIALENKPVMDLALAKKLADACEKQVKVLCCDQYFNNKYNK